MSNLTNKFIDKIIKTDNLFIKGFFSYTIPNRIFKNIYGRAISSQKYSQVVSISFDCDHSVDVNYLPKLLDNLSVYEAKYSFACVGKLIEKFPKEHQQILDEGHEIMNHTYSHPFNEELNSFNKFNELNIKEKTFEIEKCHEVCKKTLDYEPEGFRTPHFTIQYTDEIYDIISNLDYSYSSSILALKSPSFGTPYYVSDILELPVTTCPKHPFQAFDTFHAFRSKYTFHSSDDFLKVFKDLIQFGQEKETYINLYFDPQDFINFINYEIFDFLKEEKISIKNYGNLV